jgi:hypothetical protein
VGDKLAFSASCAIEVRAETIITLNTPSSNNGNQDFRTHHGTLCGKFATRTSARFNISWTRLRRRAVIAFLSVSLRAPQI